MRWETDLQPWAEKSFSSLGTNTIILATSSRAASVYGSPRARKASRAQSFTWWYSRGRNGTKESMRFSLRRWLWA